MPLLLLKCMLLVLLGWTVCACMLKNHTMWIDRQDCAQCVAITTTICSGYCYTQDTILKGRIGRTFLVQRSCVPVSLVYHPVSLPGCPEDVHTQLYYPVAQRCSCRRCDARTHHCIRTRRFSSDQCTSALVSEKSQNQSAFET